MTMPHSRSNAYGATTINATPIWTSSFGSGAMPADVVDDHDANQQDRCQDKQQQAVALVSESVHTQQRGHAKTGQECDENCRAGDPWQPIRVDSSWSDLIEKTARSGKRDRWRTRTALIANAVRNVAAAISGRSMAIG